MMRAVQVKLKIEWSWQKKNRIQQKQETFHQHIGLKINVEPKQMFHLERS